MQLLQDKCLISSSLYNGANMTHNDTDTPSQKYVFIYIIIIRDKLTLLRTNVCVFNSNFTHILTHLCVFNSNFTHILTHLCLFNSNLTQNHNLCTHKIAENAVGLQLDTHTWY